MTEYLLFEVLIRSVVMYLICGVLFAAYYYKKMASDNDLFQRWVVDIISFIVIMIAWPYLLKCLLEKEKDRIVFWYRKRKTIKSISRMKKSNMSSDPEIKAVIDKQEEFVRNLKF